MNTSEKVKAARAKLAQKFKGVNTRLGGKGTQKRKIKVKDKNNMSSSKKMKAIEKKLAVAPLPDISEVNLFRNDGNVWHFPNPNIKGSIQNQVLIVSQEPELKNIQNNFAEFVSHMGPNEMSQLKDMVKNMKPPANEEAEDKKEENKEEEEEEDEAPELVNFEEVANN